MAVRTGKEIRNFFVLLVLTASVLGNTGVCYGKEPEPAPVYGKDIKDGSYEVEVESSSSMFRIVKARLNVEKGDMTADITLSGKGYLKLFMGTGKEAEAAGEDRYIPYVEDEEGAYTYCIPVEALNVEFSCAAYSKRKETWYDRELVIRSSVLPEYAFWAEIGGAEEGVEEQEEKEELGTKELDRKESEVKGAEAKEQDRKEQSAKEPEVKGAGAKEQDRKEQSAKESETKEQDRKEQSAKEPEVKEQDRKGQGAKESETKGRETTEQSGKESGNGEQDRKEPGNGEQDGKEPGETGALTPEVLDREDGEYKIEVSMEGGTGRASIVSPAVVRVSEGNGVAVIEWSSPDFDYMVISGERYLPVQSQGNSVFEIPVLALDKEIEVIADTVAMSSPHEIPYTIVFHGDTMRKNVGGRGRLAVILVLAVAAGGAGCVFRYRHRKKHDGDT